ncbi:MAG: putative rane protein [Herbinix sp.]|jgi:FlaA1/EpsC-like NDP-sugar epimerase|nr:putative rane protein [Herbinix sp.]
MRSDRQKMINWYHVLMDVAIIIVSYLLAYYFRFYNQLFQQKLGYYYTIGQYTIFLFYIIPTYLLIYFEFRLYSVELVGRKWHMAISIIISNVVGMLSFMLLLYLRKYSISRIFLLIFLIINVALTIVSRIMRKHPDKRERKRR